MEGKMRSVKVTRNLVAYCVVLGAVGGGLACEGSIEPVPQTVSLVVSGITSPLVRGYSANLTVTATDASGNTLTGYTGTVHFTSADPAARLPADYAFVAADRGRHAFTVTLSSVGSQTVTATDVSTSAITGTQVVAVGRALYVANSGANASTIYPANAVGNATPTAIITGTNTSLDSPHGIAVDGEGRLYVTNPATNAITIYAAGAIGNAIPVATIAGPHTGLQLPIALAFDATGRLYVANRTGFSVTVYAPRATGDAAPAATIAGPNTGLHVPEALAIDGAGRLYVANLSGNTIAIFDPRATGNVTPAALIAGPDTELSAPFGLAFDGTGRLYVAGAPNVNTNFISVYPAGATGNAAPIAAILGAHTAVDRPSGLVVDDAGRLYVTNFSSNNVTVYSSGATGDATPAVIIAGINTALINPGGIALY
jgi:sugar lactone lactonase YvrE